MNRDAQVDMLQTAVPHMPAGSRVVFVTSHQAHFVETAETSIEFVVVSGDMIEGTITATLLNRLNPGAIEGRRQEVGKLYSVSEFAAEIALAAVEPIPADHTKLVGDVSGFGA